MIPKARSMSAWLRVNTDCFKSLGVVVNGQRFDYSVQIAIQNSRQIREALVDPVIGHTILWKIIRPNLLSSLAGADLRQPRLTLLALAPLFFSRIELRAQD